MANKKSEKAIEARKLYDGGMKLIDIADKLNVPSGTVRRWKSTQNWDEQKSERSDSKSERSHKGKKVAIVPIDDGTKETLQNDALTPEQRMFCIYYSKDHNAVQSYIKAYNSTYINACGHAHELLKNVEVKKEIDRLLELKASNFNFNIDELVELQMRIAFADVGNYMTFGSKDVYDDETGETFTVSMVNLKEAEYTDTQLIQAVKRGKDGVSIKLESKQAAIDWLSKYFLIHPDDKYKAEYDKKRAEVSDNSGEEILKNMKAIADILQNPVSNRKIEDYE